MLELLGLFGLLIVGAAILAVLTLFLGLLKLGFKLLLIPFALAWGLLKLVLVCCLVLVVLALMPAVLAVLVVALPALALVAVVGVGWAVIA